MQQIMEQYQDAVFDFTDVAIMALAERLSITRVCTFDHRDFSIFHPLHCDYLELLP
jgi:predicted nucleic acid-binding protein